jgi:hypothetical protein
VTGRPTRPRRGGAGWIGPALALLLSLMPAAAQERSLIDPGQAQLQRQVRSLQNRASGGPGADLQLRRARRDLVRESRGVFFTPEEARIDRDLRRVERDLRRRPAATAEPQPPEPTESELPKSYEAEPPRSGRHGSVVTVTRLLNRAETALDEDRPGQARSDLSTARGFLDDVDPEAPATRNAYAKLRARLESLKKRVDAAAGDG